MSEHPIACVTMPYYECRDGIYEIDEFDCSSCFLIIGDRSALLIDTGIGIGDLKWLIENRITDKPYEVVASHNHGDHIGGAGQFEKMWIHPLDRDLNDPMTAPTMEFRKAYTELIRNREHKNYAYDPEKDLIPWKAPDLQMLADGQEFDLGNRVVTAYHCPGHTAGEMVFLDHKTRTLLCGDACNCNWLLNTALADTGKECVSISLKALKRIYGMRDAYDSVYNFHHDFRGFGSPLADDVLPNLIEILQELHDGNAQFKEIPDALSATGGTKTIAFYGDTFVSAMNQSIQKIA